jgi:colanic acid/amylovoran biosynthesis glycosyltransferase
MMPSDARGPVADTDAPAELATSPRRCRIGYVTSRFPKTTETFIVREILAVESAGHDVLVYAIRRERGELALPGTQHLTARLCAVSDLGIAALWSQLRWARRSPRRLTRCWWRAVRGNIGSPAFLLRALVVAWGAPAVADHVRRSGVERLHAHWATHSALLAHLVNVLTDVPYSVTLHAHDLYVERTMLGPKLRGCTDILTISSHNADLISREYPDVADRVRVVRCGVEVASTTPTLHRPPRASGEPLRIVTVARFEPMKGHVHLLDAVEAVHRAGRDVRLDLVGDGEGRADIVRRAPEWVRFHGAVDNGEVQRLVREADLMVLPCIEMPDGRRDGIPVALMEAMALGTPVISTTVSGIPELVVDGETGLLVPPGDIERLADAIVRIADDHVLAARLAVAARRHVEQHHDAAANGRQLAELFAGSRAVADHAVLTVLTRDPDRRTTS